MKNIIFLLILGLGLFSSSTFAKENVWVSFSADLSGVLKDTSGNIVSGATVEIKGLSLSDLSDSLGGFSFTGLSLGTYTLIITHPDYEQLEVAVNLDVSGLKYITIEDLVMI